MKKKNSRYLLRSALIVALIVFLAVYIASDLQASPSGGMMPHDNLTLLKVLEACGIEPSQIQRVESWDSESQLSYPEIETFLASPVIAQIFSPSVKLGNYRGVHLLDIGLENREKLPQLMVFETPYEDWRVFVKIFRYQSEAGLCGTFELDRNG